MFQKCSPTRAFEDVADQIRRAIVTGELQPGERLPAQRQLADMFGVGRTTLLAALRILEKSGLIVIRPGAKGGAFVTVPSIEHMSEALDLFLVRQGSSLADLAEFRQAVEGANMVWAAQRATAAEIEAIEEQIGHLRRYHEGGEALWPAFVSAELQLHHSAAAMSHNSVSLAVLQAINTTVERSFALLPREHGGRIIGEWERLLEAVRHRRAEEAAAILKEHIAFFSHVLSQEAQRSGYTEFSLRP